MNAIDSDLNTLLRCEYRVGLRLRALGAPGALDLVLASAPQAAAARVLRAAYPARA